jgi:hypothetical protein
VYVPSAATKSSFWCWKRLELRKVTCESHVKASCLRGENVSVGASGRRSVGARRESSERDVLMAAKREFFRVTTAGPNACRGRSGSAATRTFARGAPRPGSWMMSVTTPLM